jgi:hypothetical protein
LQQKSFRTLRAAPLRATRRRTRLCKRVEPGIDVLGFDAVQLPHAGGRALKGQRLQKKGAARRRRGRGNVVG